MTIEPISPFHNTSKFKCGKHQLDHYLKKYAYQNTIDNVSTAYVIAAEDKRVQGYYSICASSIQRESIPDDSLPNHPQIGVILLARWAVDKNSQGQGIGKRLFYDALRRSANMSRQVAAFAFVVDAIDEEARDGYVAAGFHETTSDRMKLFLPMADIFALGLHDAGQGQEPEYSI